MREAAGGASYQRNNADMILLQTCRKVLLAQTVAESERAYVKLSQDVSSSDYVY